MDRDAPEPAASPRDYTDVGGHIAAILNAAEQAAEDLRAEAAREATVLRREAELEIEGQTSDSRRRAEEEAERLVASAAADARAIRDTATAASARIADEGARRLEELRLEARALESRFERVVDDLRNLIAQLEPVLVGAAERPGAEGDARPRLAPTPDLQDDLRPRPTDVSDEPAPAPAHDGTAARDAAS